MTAWLTSTEAAKLSRDYQADEEMKCTRRQIDCTRADCDTKRKRCNPLLQLSFSGRRGEDRTLDHSIKSRGIVEQYQWGCAILSGQVRPLAAIDTPTGIWTSVQVIGRSKSLLFARPNQNDNGHPESPDDAAQRKWVACCYPVGY